MPDGKPNVLFLFTDQQRWDTIAAAGFGHMVTPHLDWLATNSVRFDYAYTPSPLCTPARASIVTGCAPKRHGVWDNVTWIPDDSHTWPRIFTEAGYDTRAVGKMHSHPWRNSTGFSKRVIAEDKFAFELPDDYALWLNKKGYRRPCPWLEQLDEYVDGHGCAVWPWPEELHIDSFVGKKAIEAIEEASERHRPFCYWVSFNSPHGPHDPPQRFLDMYERRRVPAPVRRPSEPGDKPASRLAMQQMLEQLFGMKADLSQLTDERIEQRRKHYYATITFVDSWIGRIVKTLKKTGVYENTIIVFSSDHGDAQGDHNMIEKGFFYEPMVHVPLIVHCPARIAPGVSEEFVNLTDICPTLLSLAGLGASADVDGHDLSPLLLRNGPWQSRDAVFSEYCWLGRRMTMVRTRQWKLVYEDDPAACELFDLRVDSDELSNVYHEPAHYPIRDELVGRAKDWRSTGGPLFQSDTLLRSDYFPHLFPERDRIVRA